MIGNSSIFSDVKDDNLIDLTNEDIKYYHGSSVVVDNPKIIINKNYKDFGYGFYVTKFEKQAEKWARRNLIYNKSAIISCFKLNDCSDLNVKVFEDPTDEWIDFIGNCRNGKLHEFDIVEGPMADDKVFLFAEQYFRGELSRDEFRVICEFRKPTHQICFCTEKSLAYLEFLGSYKIEK